MGKPDWDTPITTITIDPKVISEQIRQKAKQDAKNLIKANGDRQSEQIILKLGGNNDNKSD